MNKGGEGGRGKKKEKNKSENPFHATCSGNRPSMTMKRGRKGKGTTEIRLPPAKEEKREEEGRQGAAPSPTFLREKKPSSTRRGPARRKKKRHEQPPAFRPRRGRRANASAVGGRGKKVKMDDVIPPSPNKLRAAPSPGGGKRKGGGERKGKKVAKPRHAAGPKKSGENQVPAHASAAAERGESSF